MKTTYPPTQSNSSAALAAFAWIFGLAAGILFVLALAGCADLAKMGEILSTKNPTTGTMPGDDITWGMIGVLANPFNWSSWALAGGGVTTVLSGWLAWRKLHK